jgi:hypothetical protein
MYFSGGLTMRQLTKVSIAVACALGVTAAVAQTVQRGGQEVKPAQTRAPVQVSQTVFGGPAAGASAAAPVAASAGVAAAGTTAIIVGGLFAVAGAAADSGSSEPAVTHTP